MNGLISVFKKKTLTPLESVKKLRSHLGLSEQIKIGYAGRLDPLASGVLLLMIGEECKKRDTYQSLDKTYQFKLLFGVSTDSLDPMGVINSYSGDKFSYDESKLLRSVEVVSKMKKQKYPLYSSYMINGKQMYKLAKEGKINQEDRPFKDIDIKSFRLLEHTYLARDELIDQFIEDISSVSGLFRQERIISKWNDVRDSLPTRLLSIKLEAEVASGTYVRVIGEDIFQKLEKDGLVYDISRINVGNFSVEDSIKL